MTTIVVARAVLTTMVVVSRAAVTTMVVARDIRLSLLLGLF